MTALLDVRDLSRRLRQGRGRARVSLRVERGSIVTVIGPTAPARRRCSARSWAAARARRIVYDGAHRRADGGAARRARARAGAEKRELFGR
jgi:hypothetical protein